MKFNYIKFTLTKPSSFFGKAILKPIIPVYISYRNRSFRYTALIDSGADFCIFDAQVGEYMGIDIKSGHKEIFGGIQEKGGAEAFLHKILINIGGKNYEIVVGFSYDIAGHGFGILGQKGFFEKFVVKFNLFKEQIELKERG